MLTPRTKAILFFFGTLAASVLIIVWFTVWNNGTLEISGNGPFTIKIDEDRTVECTENPCDILLKPGFYIVSVEKDNTFPQKFGVTIIRNHKTLQEVALESVPTLTEPIDAHTYTFPGSEKITTNLQKIDTSTLTADVALQPLPEGVQKLTFTGADGPIIATTEKAVYIAASPLARLTKIALLPTDSWLVGNENTLYYFTNNTGTSRQALMAAPISASGVTTTLGTPKVLSYFEQPIVSALLREEPTLGKLFIFDTGGAEGHVYGLDLKTYTRTVLGDLPNVDGVTGLSSEMLAIETRTNRSNTTALYLFDTAQKTFTEMAGWPEIGQIAFTQKGTIIIASGTDLPSQDFAQKSNLNILADLLQTTSSSQAPTESQKTIWYEYNIVEKKYTVLLEEKLAPPSWLFVDSANADQVKFMRDGKWQTMALNQSN